MGSRRARDYWRLDSGTAGRHQYDLLSTIAFFGLGIAADGQKHALGLWDGSTENATVAKAAAFRRLRNVPSNFFLAFKNTRPPLSVRAERRPSRNSALKYPQRAQWTTGSTCKRAISSFTSNLRRFNSTISRSSIDGWALASLISASNARCRLSSSARWVCMDMLGGSPGRQIVA